MHGKTLQLSCVGVHWSGGQRSFSHQFPLVDCDPLQQSIPNNPEYCRSYIGDRCLDLRNRDRHGKVMPGFGIVKIPILTNCVCSVVPILFGSVASPRPPLLRRRSLRHLLEFSDLNRQQHTKARAPPPTTTTPPSSLAHTFTPPHTHTHTRKRERKREQN